MLNNFKRVISLLLVVMLIFSIQILAEDEGVALEWEYENKTLTIYGDGDMKDYGGYNIPMYVATINYDDRYYIHAPWRKHKEKAEKIVIEDGVTKIGSHAFYDFDKLEEVEIPRGVKVINNSAFAACKNLKEIELPITLKEIGKRAFEKCGFETVFIPRKVEKIDTCAFDGCQNLKEILVDEDNEHYTSKDGVLFTKDMSVLCDYPTKGNAVYEIPVGVKKISYSAFSESTSLVSLQIPIELEEVDDFAFYYCKNLKEINYEGSREDWRKIKVAQGNDALKEAKVNYNCVIERVKPEEKQIILTIDDTNAIVFGEIAECDVAPKIINGRTMLPARFVAENLGAMVEWDATEPNKISVKNEDVEVIIYIGEDVAFINGEEIEIDSPAFVENNRTYTPVRFIVEALGATAEWKNETRQVIITK